MFSSLRRTIKNERNYLESNKESKGGGNKESGGIRRGHYMAAYRYPGHGTGQEWTLEPGSLEGKFWGEQ